MDLTIGVDVGGTKIAAGVGRRDGAVIVENAACRRPRRRRRRSRTASSSRRGRVPPRHDVGRGRARRGGLRGREARDAAVRAEPAHGRRPLRETVGARVGLPVVVENDANAAAWGEYRFGGGGAIDDMVLLTVGTGSAAASCMAGELSAARSGWPPSSATCGSCPGGLPCGCGNHGCWEQYARGPRWSVWPSARSRHDRVAGAALLELAGGTPTPSPGTMVTEAATAGRRGRRRLSPSSAAGSAKASRRSRGPRPGDDRGRRRRQRGG